MEALLINPPSASFPKQGHVLYKDEQGNTLELPYEIKRVKIRKLKKENASSHLSSGLCESACCER